MRNKLVVAGIMSLALAGCAADGATYGAGAGYYDGGYAPYYDGYGAYGYNDYYGPNSGIFYGSLYFGNQWYSGPHRYRDGRFGREYWFRNGWHRPDRDGRPDRDHVGNNNGGAWHPTPPRNDGNAGTPGRGPGRGPGRDDGPGRGDWQNRPDAPPRANAPDRRNRGNIFERAIDGAAAADARNRGGRGAPRENRGE